MRLLAVLGAAALTCGLAPEARAEQLPAGSDIYDGIAVNVSQQGIDFIETQAPALVPSTVYPPAQSGELFACLLDTSYYTIYDTEVYVEVDDVEIVPTDGALEVVVDAWVAADTRVRTEGCLFNNNCKAVLDWSPVQASTDIELGVVVNPDTGRPMVDASVPAFDVDMDLATPSISECGLGSFIELLLGLFMDEVEASVKDAIQNQVAGEIEPMIEEAFNGLNMAGSLPLMDAEVGYELFPSDILVNATEGVTLVMGGVVQAVEPHRCTKGGPGGSRFTPGPLPAFANSLSPGGAAYDLAASLSDDLMNQGLFAAWHAGMLCLEVDSVADGEPLTTDMLALLGGEASRLVTPGGDMVIALSSTTPPEGDVDGPKARIGIEDLRLDIMAEVHGRLARVAQLKVSPELDAGIDIANEQIIPELTLDSGTLDTELTYNELLPKTGPTLVELLPTMVDGFLPYLDVPPIALPDLAGLTLESPEMMQDGPDGNYLSAYTGLGGQVDPDAAGGCGLPSGGGGPMTCAVSRDSASGRTGVALLGWIGLMVGLLRRRRLHD